MATAEKVDRIQARANLEPPDHPAPPGTPVPESALADVNMETFVVPMPPPMSRVPVAMYNGEDQRHGQCLLNCDFTVDGDTYQNTVDLMTKHHYNHHGRANVYLARLEQEQAA